MKKQVVTEPVLWKCTTYGCNYLITDTEIKAHKFDLGCPKCKKCEFRDFIIKNEG